MVLARGSTLMDLPGVGPVVAARILADVGDVARFADRNRFASWTGTAPLDASSGEQIRHRLSRAGNRKMNHMLHIAAATQIRLDTDGRAYYRRKLAAGKTRMEAMRCLKRRISDAVYRQLVADARAATHDRWHGPGRALRGVSRHPARSTCPRTSTLRISHFPDPHTPTLQPTTATPEEPARPTPRASPLTTEGSRYDAGMGWVRDGMVSGRATTSRRTVTGRCPVHRRRGSQVRHTDLA